MFFRRFRSETSRRAPYDDQDAERDQYDPFDFVDQEGAGVEPLHGLELCGHQTLHYHDGQER